MPRTDVVFYREDDDRVPVLDEACVAAIERLGAFGYELRRPLADFLRDGIYELQVRKGRVNNRLLYFFRGRNLVILGHAPTREGKVPKADIEGAIRRKRAFEADPSRPSYSEEEKA